jgi:hypothetical protein
MSLLTELYGELLTESGLPLLAENETESGSPVSGAVYLKAKATLSLAARAALSSVKVFTSLPMKAKATLKLIGNGQLHAMKPLKAKAVLRLIARQGIAQPPSSLGAKMKILVDPYRPDVIHDQYLLVWFNGHPSQCKVALKIDDGVEWQPAFTWQNPGVTNPAIIKIDSAEIVSDGKKHRITISVWQAVGHQTSARATIAEEANTPNLRPATQPEWCGNTGIRQGEIVRGGPYNNIVGHVSDSTRIEWRHSGAVQIMAQVPVANDKTTGFHQSIVTIGYADYDENQFIAEDVGTKIGWRGGALHDVLFGVASIHNGTFGPVCWANTPVKIREVLSTPATLETNPDVIAKTNQTLDFDKFSYEVASDLFSDNDWVYPRYWDAPSLETKRRDIIFAAIEKTLRKIKDSTRHGGSVTLDNLGRFEARWNPERTVRSVSFIASISFVEGTRAGIVLTDAQAKAMP